MDIVVRRQSEQLGRHLSGQYDDSGSDEIYAKKSDDFFDIKKWEWGQLRVSARFDFMELIKLAIDFQLSIFHFFSPFVHTQTECKNLGLEAFYRTYVTRLQRSYLSIFFVIHTIIGMVHTIVLVATQVRLLIRHGTRTMSPPNDQQKNNIINILLFFFMYFLIFVWFSETFSN